MQYGGATVKVLAFQDNHVPNRPKRAIIDPIFGHREPPMAPFLKPKGGKLSITMAGWIAGKGVECPRKWCSKWPPHCGPHTIKTLKDRMGFWTLACEAAWSRCYFFKKTKIGFEVYANWPSTSGICDVVPCGAQLDIGGSVGWSRLHARFQTFITFNSICDKCCPRVSSHDLMTS